MFTTMLVGILLMASLIMLVLLVGPRPNDDIRTGRLPYVGIIVALLWVALALFGVTLA